MNSDQILLENWTKEFDLHTEYIYNSFPGSGH